MASFVEPTCEQLTGEWKRCRGFRGDSVTYKPKFDPGTIKRKDCSLECTAHCSSWLTSLLQDYPRTALIENEVKVGDDEKHRSIFARSPPVLGSLRWIRLRVEHHMRPDRWNPNPKYFHVLEAKTVVDEKSIATNQWLVDGEEIATTDQVAQAICNIIQEALEVKFSIRHDPEMQKRTPLHEMFAILHDNPLQLKFWVTVGYSHEPFPEPAMGFWPRLFLTKFNCPSGKSTWFAPPQIWQHGDRGKSESSFFIEHTLLFSPDTIQRIKDVYAKQSAKMIHKMSQLDPGARGYW